MPELLRQRASLLRSVRDARLKLEVARRDALENGPLPVGKPKPEEIYRQEVQRARETYPGEIVGAGAESVVVSQGSDRVAAAYWKINIDGERARQIFYWQRIMHTLFPYNIPAVHAAWGAVHPEDMERVAGTIRQRITPEQGNTPVTYPLENVVKFVERYGLSLYFDIDTMPQNITRAKDGGEYYVEPILHVWGHEAPVVTDHMITSILQQMEQSKLDNTPSFGGVVYTDKNIDAVRKAFQRLQAIAPTHAT